jgi:hypothetical protein
MALGCGQDTYAAAHDVLRRLGACWSDGAARRVVEAAVGTEVPERVTRRPGTSRGRTAF